MDNTPLEPTSDTSSRYYGALCEIVVRNSDAVCIYAVRLDIAIQHHGLARRDTKHCLEVAFRQKLSSQFVDSAPILQIQIQLSDLQDNKEAAWAWIAAMHAGIRTAHDEIGGVAYEIGNDITSALAELKTTTDRT